MKLDVQHANRATVRLHDFDQGDLRRFRSCVADLANLHRCVIALHDERFVSPGDGCRLTLRLGRLDRGIERSVEPNLFGWIHEPGAWDPYTCELTPQTWSQVTSGVDQLLRLRFLCSEYLWLHKQWEGHGSVAWLLSPNGEW